MNYKNKMKLKFLAVSENESFARVCVASFCSVLNPTLDELTDIKTAVSEAVTNSVVHAYPDKKGDIEISAEICDNEVYITVTDYGVGIPDIEKAREPFFTTNPTKERSGMGFTVMEGFMDKVIVESIKGRGTSVTLIKRFGDVEVAIGG